MLAGMSGKSKKVYCTYFERTFRKWDYFCLNGLIFQDKKCKFHKNAQIYYVTSVSCNFQKM